MDNIVSNKYVKGFNASYIIAEHKPKLMDSLLQTSLDTDYMKGMKDGKLTLDKEKTKFISKTNTRLEELDQLKSSKNRDKKQDLEL